MRKGCSGYLVQVDKIRATRRPLRICHILFGMLSNASNRSFQFSDLVTRVKSAIYGWSNTFWSCNSTSFTAFIIWNHRWLLLKSVRGGTGQGKRNMGRTWKKAFLKWRAVRRVFEEKLLPAEEKGSPQTCPQTNISCLVTLVQERLSEAWWSLWPLRPHRPIRLYCDENSQNHP